MDPQRISKIQAMDLLEEEFGCKLYNLMYYSFPQVFSTTAGPFHQYGQFAGQAFTEFQMEVWTDGKYALVFCGREEVAYIECDQPFTVDWYLSQRKYHN
jgi:hypothetical protein